MMEEHTAYDYCICFMEQEAERMAAEGLIKEISAYRLPRNIQKSKESYHYKNGYMLAVSGRTPLSGEQLALLDNCRWLMVICTSRTPGIPVISQVINYFSRNRGKGFILPVLLEGEPQDAFPKEFFEERVTTVTFADGTTQTINEIIEPLAIDIRAKDLKTSLSLLRHVRIKVVAALEGVSYDTLEQRHEKRARRKLRVLLGTILAIPVILGSFFTYQWFHARYQIDIATKKTQISKDLLADMCENYPALFNEFPDAKPAINALLINSIEKLRVAESAFIPMLPVDELLIPDAKDDFEQLRNKAKILRYIERKQDSVRAYEMASRLLEKGSEMYSASARMFVEKTSPTDYPSGVWVKSIDAEVSEKCGGLAEGDIIVQTDGFKFRNIDQFEIYVFSDRSPKKVKLTVLRPYDEDFEVLKLEVKPADLVFEREEM